MLRIGKKNITIGSATLQFDEIKINPMLITKSKEEKMLQIFNFVENYKKTHDKKMPSWREVGRQCEVENKTAKKYYHIISSKPITRRIYDNGLGVKIARDKKGRIKEIIRTDSNIIKNRYKSKKINTRLK